MCVCIFLISFLLACLFVFLFYFISWCWSIAVFCFCVCYYRHCRAIFAVFVAPSMYGMCFLSSARRKKIIKSNRNQIVKNKKRTVVYVRDAMVTLGRMRSRSSVYTRTYTHLHTQKKNISNDAK